MNFSDILKVLILSVVEGITEFLPISSTGHLIIVNDFVQLSPEAFSNAFSVIIQLGAILSVVVIYFTKLNPFTLKKIPPHRIPKRYKELNVQSRIYFLLKNYDRKTIDLWKKVLVGMIPAAVFGFLLDDWIDAHLFNSSVVAAMLIVWGIALIIVESKNRGEKNYTFETVYDLDYKTAFLIGLFQCLAMVPGTSRSASTIIGAMLLGASRLSAADFSFFLAIPTMLGATVLKVVKNSAAFSGTQWLLILLGAVVSFLVALIVIRKFLGYIQKHDFKVFGFYRILLGIVVILYTFVLK